MKQTIVRPSTHKQVTLAKHHPTISYINIPTIQPPKPLHIGMKHNPRNVQRSIYTTPNKQPVQKIETANTPTNSSSQISIMVKNIIGMNCRYCHSDNLHVWYEDVIKGRPLMMFVVCLECGSRYKAER